eukprot:TRINITY_DN4455_c0_g1_i1.p1 TRINITY_DN4455_c0_g1~~TRINITY_DN4455_c0_g1_i1.p1  ORF type:complete len:365 (+),score=91.72 TRINITY_DN4455_c0_g1_i1:41-1096(+)
MSELTEPLSVPTSTVQETNLSQDLIRSSISKLLQRKLSRDEQILEFVQKQVSVQFWIEKVLRIRLSSNLSYELKTGVVLCFLLKEIYDITQTQLQQKESKSVQSNAQELCVNNSQVVTQNQALLVQIQQNSQEFQAFFQNSFRIEKPETPAASKQNIENFLKGALFFGLPLEKLFQVNDLWEGTHTVLVIECVEQIAKIVSPIAYPYQLVDCDHPFVKKILSSGEEIASIRRQLAEIEKKKQQSQPQLMIQKTRRRLFSSNQQADLVQNAAKIQAWWRMVQSRKEFLKRARAAEYRKKVVKELLDTETEYVKNLELCVRIYLNPLKEGAKKGKGFLSQDEIVIIFQKLRQY